MGPDFCLNVPDFRGVPTFLGDEFLILGDFEGSLDLLLTGLNVIYSSNSNVTFFSKEGVI